MIGLTVIYRRKNTRPREFKNPAAKPLQWQYNLQSQGFYSRILIPNRASVFHPRNHRLNDHVCIDFLQYGIYMLSFEIFQKIPAAI